ncbi:MAG: hypothetical protein BWX86_02694 [Verrucomicrobia bacterium ADurb.Bin122]|nr:MAG: hypothetical protein BWX86_02694 [Verrucomicrobia bacterium ADurb.Bin122]
MTLETTRTPESGRRRGTAATAARKSTSIGSINDECAASVTCSRLQRTPSRSSSTANASTASAGPATTIWSGALTVAMSSERGRRSATSGSVRFTASIAPGACASIALPRRQTSRRASVSVKTPARHAATHSPKLCPMSTLGRRPRSIQKRAAANSRANTAGCPMRCWLICVIAPASSGAASSSVRRSSFSTGSSSVAHSSITARKTGAWS